MVKKLRITTFIIILIILASHIYELLQLTVFHKPVDFYGGKENAPIELLEYEDVIEKCNANKWDQECYYWISSHMYDNVKIIKTQKIQAIMDYNKYSTFHCYNTSDTYNRVIENKKEFNIKVVDEIIKRLRSYCLEKNCSYSCSSLSRYYKGINSSYNISLAVAYIYLYHIYDKRGRSLMTLNRGLLESNKISKEQLHIDLQKVNTQELNGYLTEKEIGIIIEANFRPR